MQPSCLCLKLTISRGSLRLPASLHFPHSFYLFLSFLFLESASYFTEKIEATRENFHMLPPHLPIRLHLCPRIGPSVTTSELSLSLTPILPRGH